MDIIDRIDSKLMIFFQKLTDIGQVWFGFDNFAICRILLILYMLFSFAEFAVVIFIEQRLRTLGFDIMMIILTAFICYALFGITRYIENQCSSGSFKNQFEIILQPYRFPIIIILCVQSIIWSFISEDKETAMELAYNYFSKISYILFLYFISCTPNPKQKSKIKKFFENLSTQFTLKPVRV